MAQDRDGRCIAPKSLERLRNVVIASFAQGSFRDLKIRDIARQAKVGPATIYKYFGSKDELLFACIQPEVQALGASLLAAKAASENEHSRERMRDFADIFISFYLKHRQIGEIVYLTIPVRNWIDNPAFIQVQKLAVGADILRDGQVRGEIRSDVSAEMLIDLMAGAIHRYMMRTLLSPTSLTEVAHADRLIGIFWPMIASSGS
jgi:TetR/AcrR family transcriptional regulator, fatty acid metabolism regulator protein